MPHTAPAASCSRTAGAGAAALSCKCAHLQIDVIIIMLHLAVGERPWALFRVRVVHSALPRSRLCDGLLLCCLWHKPEMCSAISGWVEVLRGLSCAGLASGVLSEAC